MDRATKEHTLSENRQDSQFIKSIRISFCVSLYLCLFIYPFAIYAESQSITIIYQQNKTFAKKIVNRVNNKLISKNHQTQLLAFENIDAESKNLINNTHLIATFGISATEYALKSNPRAPIISFLIPRHAYQYLSALYQGNNWTVNFIDHPLERQLLLIKYLLGQDKVIGTILGNDSEQKKQQLTSLGKSLKQEIIVNSISSSDHLISSLKSLTNKIDVLLALPDPVVFNNQTIRGTLLLTYRKNIPMIGFSRGYVKAGAIASLYSDSKQISDQSYRLIVRHIESDGTLNKQYFPDDFHIAINEKVARSLGINLVDIKKLTSRIKRDERK